MKFHRVFGLIVAWFGLLAVGRAIEIGNHDLSPGSDEWVDGQWDLGYQAIAAGRFADAAPFFVHAEYYSLDRPDAYDFDHLKLDDLLTTSTAPIDQLRKARALRYFDKPEKAAEIYQTLERKFRYSPLIHCEQAMQLLENGDFKGASLKIDCAAAMKPDSAHVAAARGAMLQAQGKHAAARVEYQKAMSANPYLKGLHGRLLLLEKRDRDAAAPIDRFHIDAKNRLLDVVREAAWEREELGLCFPWRLAKTSTENEPVEPFAAAAERLYRGDIQGAVAAIATLQSNSDLTNDQKKALHQFIVVAYLAVDDCDRATAAGLSWKYVTPLFARPDWLPGIHRLLDQKDEDSNLKNFLYDLKLGDLGRLPDIKTRESGEDLLTDATQQTHRTLTSTRNSKRFKTTKNAEKDRNRMNGVFVHLERAISAPSIVAADPLTLTSQFIPDRLTQNRWKADYSRQLSYGDPTEALSTIRDTLQPPSITRARDRYKVRTLAGWRVNRSNLSLLYFELGKQFREADGQEQNQPRATKLLEFAAKQLPEAAYYLAQDYHLGRHVQKDPAVAHRFYVQAAEGGIKAANVAAAELRRLYQKPDKRPDEDDLEGDNWWPREYWMSIKEFPAHKLPASEKRRLETPVYSVPVSNTSTDVIEAEAMRGNAHAQWLLGECYLFGQLDYWRTIDNTNPRIYPLDPVKGFNWVHAAAQQGHPRAQILTARAYYFGYGVAPNAKEAESWRTKAEAAGESLAEYLIPK